jgi:hypothetical protein
MGLKVDTIQNPSSATVNLTLDTSGNVTAGANLAVTGTSTFTGSLGNITAGTVTASGLVTGATGALYPVVQGTAQASTSGTSIDFTSIPSWVKRITVMFSGVSTNGTSAVQIQLGTSSGPTTTGYSSASFSYNSGTGATSTTGLVVDQVTSAANSRYGLITIATLGSNVWVSQGILQMTSSLSVTPSTGGVTLGAVLDRIRITTVNGTDTFDAGSINIQYE